MDQCKNCSARGDVGKCINAECTIHESWYVMELKNEILKNQDNRNFGGYTAKQIIAVLDTCSTLEEASSYFHSFFGIMG